MTRLLRVLVGPIKRWLKPRRDRLLAQFRAQVVLALSDELKQLAERHERQFHDVNVYVEALSRDMMRLQRQLDELGALWEPTADDAIIAFPGREPQARLVA